jgi:hypothetical protein
MSSTKFHHATVLDFVVAAMPDIFDVSQDLGL